MRDFISILEKLETEEKMIHNSDAKKLISDLCRAYAKTAIEIMEPSESDDIFSCVFIGCAFTVIHFLNEGGISFNDIEVSK